MPGWIRRALDVVSWRHAAETEWQHRMAATVRPVLRVSVELLVMVYDKIEPRPADLAAVGQVLADETACTVTLTDSDLSWSPRQGPRAGRLPAEVAADLVALSRRFAEVNSGP